MRRLAVHRLLTIVATACLLALVLAPAALAAPDGGQGAYGPANDKVVTNAGFIVIAFFPLLILAMSILQWRLEKRKDARKAAAKHRLSSSDWRGGW